VCEAKGVSAGTTVNLVFTLVIGLTTQSFVNHWTKEWTFMMFGAFNIVAAVVLGLFAKESNGKTEEELFYLYRKDKPASMVKQNEDSDE
jgi:quinol-cytochrome oxidoreductase complex cytochrome b subunit